MTPEGRHPEASPALRLCSRNTKSDVPKPIASTFMHMGIHPLSLMSVRSRMPCGRVPDLARRPAARVALKATRQRGILSAKGLNCTRTLRPPISPGNKLGTQKPQAA